MNEGSQKMTRTIFVLLIIILGDFMTGCQQQTDNSDLIAWIEKVNQRKRVPIAPLPELSHNELMDRNIGRNPFEPLVKDEE